MRPTFWFKIQIKGDGKRIRIPFPLPLILPLVLAIEILAVLPVAIYSIRKKKYLPLRFVLGFYFSRFLSAFIIHGGNFRVRVCDGDDVVYVGG
jgi:hypothetical protein